MKQLSRKKIQDMIDLNGANISSRRSSGGSGAGGGGGVSSAWVDEHYVSKDFFARLFTINGTDENDDDVVVEPNDLETTITNIQAMVGLWTEEYLSALGQGSGGGGGGGALLTEPLASINEAGMGTPSSPNQVIAWDGVHWTYKPYATGSGTVTSVTMTVPTGFKVSNGDTQTINTTGTFALSFGGSITKNQVLASPAAANGTPAWRALVADDIPTLTAAKISDITLTNSTLTIGNNSITPITDATLKSDYEWWGGKLDATTKKRDGNMSNVGNISFSDTGKNIGSVAYFDTTNHRLGIDRSPGAYKLDVNGDIRTSGNLYIGGTNRILSGSGDSAKNLLEFDGTQVTLAYGFRASNETRIYGQNISMYHGSTLKVQVTSTGLKIGDATLSWDSTNHALKIDTGFYSESFISALGAGSGGGSGSGITMNDVWDALAATSSQQINLTHLTTALSSYASKTWVQSQGFVTTDTKNTAGNFDIHGAPAAFPIYLVGTQGYSGNSGSYGATFVNHACYIDTNNCLYSNGSKVLTSASGLMQRTNLSGTSFDANTMTADMTVYSTAGDVSATSSANLPEPVGAGGFSLLNFRLGYAYNWQLYKTYGRNTLFFRGQYYSGGVSWQNWREFAFKDDIPTKVSQLTNDSGFITSYTDTKNTAGNFDIHGTPAAFPIYLVGTQGYSGNSGSYGATFVNHACYIDTDNCLYSNGSKVLTSTSGLVTTDTAQTISGTKTFSSIAALTFTNGASNRVFSINNNGAIKLDVANVGASGWEAGYYAKSGNTYIGCLGLFGVGTALDYAFIGKGYDNTWLTVKSNGNVGIGTNNTNPSTKLHVVGDGYFTSRINVGDIDQYHAFYVKGNTKLSGLVGIGTAAQSGYSLYVNGDTNVNGTLTSGNLMIQKASNGKMTIQTIPSGTGLPPYDLDIYAGNIYINAATSFSGSKNYSGSDMRYKDVLENISCDVDTIARAPIFDFKWKDDEYNNISLGSSAQYWKEVFPNAVKAGQEGRYFLDYGGTALAAAVLTARKVVNHEERILELERENMKLREEIELLKAS